MEERSGMPMSNPFMNFPQWSPFYPGYNNQSSFNWQNTPGYATCKILNYQAFLNKLGADLCQLGKNIDENNRKLSVTLKVNKYLLSNALNSIILLKP